MNGAATFCVKERELASLAGNAFTIRWSRVTFNVWYVHAVSFKVPSIEFQNPSDIAGSLLTFFVTPTVRPEDKILLTIPLRQFNILDLIGKINTSSVNVFLKWTKIDTNDWKEKTSRYKMHFCLIGVLVSKLFSISET